ncbi:MAG: alpha/beta hydrolase [Acidobacteriota bacterium]|nr:alpha/beta hydrolase [Acidobacteriota bacterium]
MATSQPDLSFLWPLLKGLLVIYVVLVGSVYLFQRKLQYFPNADPVPLPQGQAFRGLQEIELETEDGIRLLSWYWPGDRPLTLVYFSGNGGNRADRLEWARDFHRLGYGLFLLEYRGYGGNPGTPTERNLYRDAQAALDWLARDPGRKLAYLGESLGSGVAVEMATRAPPAGLIIQSGFSSAADVGQHRYPLLPVGLLMKDPFDSLPKIKGLSCPLLAIHGDRDRTVPLPLGWALFEAAPEPKEWLMVPGAAHNDVSGVGGQSYWKKIDDFLNEVSDSGPNGEAVPQTYKQ